MGDVEDAENTLTYASATFVDGMTAQEMEELELKEAFELFDKDGSGEISCRELGSVLRALGRNPTQKELETIMFEADADNSGGLNYDQYLTVIRGHLPPLDDVKNGLREAFAVFDQDGSGTLCIEELRNVIISMGEPLTDKEATMVLDKMDTSRDGKIDCEEFVNFLSSKVCGNS